ncbi:MAG: hypothetical protein ACK449_19570 [Planctomycetota bacterium]
MDRLRDSIGDPSRFKTLHESPDSIRFKPIRQISTYGGPKNKTTNHQALPMLLFLDRLWALMDADTELDECSWSTGSSMCADKTDNNSH